MCTGKQLKELINKHISDDDIVCFGEEGDKAGQYDRQIIGVETRNIGFHDNSVYKAIVTKRFCSHGALKFYNK